MRDDGHEACVDHWLAQTTSLSTSELLDDWERAFNAVWRRTHETLGEVTLGAILDRVLLKAAKRHSVLACLEPAKSGISCRGLGAPAGEMSREELVALLRSVMLEFLTVIGNLTADILTDALHATLREQRSQVAERAPGDESASANPNDPSKPSRKPSHV